MVEGNTVSGRENKIWGAILGVLSVMIVVLSIVIVTVNLSHGGGSLEEERQIQEQIQLGNDATAQCNDVNDSYDIGAISLDIAKQYFENAIAENDDNMYKMYVIVCYADFVYDAGEGIDSAVAVMNRLEPWLDEDIMRLNYYTGLRDLYNEDGNMEQANYYNDLAYELGEEMDGKR